LGLAAPAFAQDKVTSDPDAPEGDLEQAAEEESTAAEEDTSEAERSESGWVINTALGVRGLPLGLSVFTDFGYRFALFESASALLKNTYVDAGVATGLSPAYVWAGGYVDALPLQVLGLRFTAQYLDYWGTFGVPFEADNPDDPDWSLDGLDAVQEADGGVPTTGIMLQAQATPRAKVGNLVITAETSFTSLDMDFNDVYYEPFFDLVLDPQDTFLITRPTLGWVFTMDKADSWVLAGFRWEHTHVYGRDYNRELAALLALWKLPSGWIETGEPKVALVGGWWIDHPDRTNEPWIGGQFTMDFGATGSTGDSD
jgi:hypothetical protein